MYYDYGYNTSYDTSGLAGLTGGLLIFTFIISFAAAAFGIAIMWKIFKKAGKEGWISLIPFYNTYTLFEITWGKGWYFLLLFLAIIPVIGYIAVLIVAIMTMNKLSKAFGKDTGFTVGLVFLSVIFMAILAFDSSEYLGVPDKNGYTKRTSNNQYDNVNQPFGPPQTEPVQNPYQNVTAEPTQFSVLDGPTTPTIESNNVTPTQTSSQTFCSNCGTPLTADTMFCPNCGTPKSR